MTKSTKTTAFAWDDKNTAVAIAMYNESNNDNSKKALLAIAEKVGAKSENAVRAKLSAEKVYVKVAPTTATKRTSKLTKIERVQNLEALAGLERDSLDTLEKANASTLDTLTARLAEMGTPKAIKQAYADLIEAENEAQALAEEKAEMQEVNELANAE